MGGFCRGKGLKHPQRNKKNIRRGRTQEGRRVTTADFNEKLCSLHLHGSGDHWNGINILQSMDLPSRHLVPEN